MADYMPHTAHEIEQMLAFQRRSASQVD